MVEQAGMDFPAATTAMMQPRTSGVGPAAGGGKVGTCRRLYIDLQQFHKQSLENVTPGP